MAREKLKRDDMEQELPARVAQQREPSASDQASDQAAAQRMSAVQLKRASDGEADVEDQAVAREGLGGSATAFPHKERIEASFGRAIPAQARVGGQAAEAADELGAHAFTMGRQVGFAGQPDLHTAAHEAAHTIQQGSAVRLKGPGQDSDEQEQEADAIADRVVAGKSAADLLPATDEDQSEDGEVQLKPKRKNKNKKVTAPAKDPTATEAVWTFDRREAKDNKNHKYSADNVLMVSDTLVATRTIPGTQKDNHDKIGSWGVFGGDPGALVQTDGGHWKDEKFQLTFQAKFASAGDLSLFTSDFAGASSFGAKTKSFQVANSLNFQQTRVQSAQGEVLQKFFEAGKWMNEAAGNYQEAYAKHNEVVKEASKPSVIGSLLMTAASMALGPIAGKLAGAVLQGSRFSDKAIEKLTEWAKEGGSKIPEAVMGSPGEFTAAGQDPVKVLTSAGAKLNGEATNLQVLVNRLNNDVSAAQQGGNAKDKEFTEDPLVQVNKAASLQAEVYGVLQSQKVPTAIDFEREIWKVWLGEYSWTVKGDGTTKRRVKQGDGEYNEITHKYKAVEVTPSKIKQRIRDIVGQDLGDDFIDDASAPDKRREEASARSQEHTTVEGGSVRKY